jgi:hypothetical protein
MDRDDLQRSYALLGLTSDANLREVETAYRQLRELFDEASLATYSLLDYADRQEKLESLQIAFDVITQSRICPLPQDEPPVTSDTGTVCDPRTTPGLHLQQHRERLGLSLQDVAERTKIGIYHLRNIEAQNCDKLPANVYLRGFVREFARTVSVEDVDAVVDGFMAISRQPTESN